MLSEEEKRLVGGSDVAAILGLSPYASAFSVWARIVKGVEPAVTPAMRAGTHAESYIRALYSERGAVLLGGRKLRPSSRLRASLDDVEKTGNGRAAVEFKRCNGESARAWELGVPDYYAIQGQWYVGWGLELGELDVPRCHFVPLLNGELPEDLGSYRWEHSPEDFEWAKEGVSRFWRDHVETDTPPPLVNPRRDDVDAMPCVYPREREGYVQWDSLPLEAQVAIGAWLSAKRSADASAKEAERWEAEVRAAIGERAGVEGLPLDVRAHRLDWKTQGGPSQVDLKALSDALKHEDPTFARRMTELLEQHTKKTTRRPLNVRWRKEQ